MFRRIRFPSRLCRVTLAIREPSISDSPVGLARSENQPALCDFAARKMVEIRDDGTGTETKTLLFLEIV